MKAPEPMAVAMLGPELRVSGGLYFPVERINSALDADNLVAALRLVRRGLDEEVFEKLRRSASQKGYQ